MIEIVFGPSSSKSYRRALTLAKKCSSYSEIDGEHYVAWTDKDVDFLIPLYSLIENWKGTRVLIDGSETKHPRILTSWMMCYDLVKQGDSCFRINNYDVGPAFPFGCRGPRELQFWRYSAWLRIGKLSGRAWVFDKVEILRFVTDKLRDYRLCPKRRPEWLTAFLDVFPATVDPASDLLWAYQTRDGLATVASLHVMIGHPKEDTPMDIKEVVGVGPTDPIAGHEILKQLFALVNLKHNLTGG